MRRSEKAVTELSDIETILKQGRVCQLALTDDPVPYIVSMNYGYHDNSLYFHSAGEGRKIDLLRKKRQAAFSVVLDHGLVEGRLACQWSTRYQSVVGHGQIIFLETEDEKRQGLDRIMAQYSEQPFSLLPDILLKTTVFRLDIEEMTAKQSRIL